MQKNIDMLIKKMAEVGGLAITTILTAISAGFNTKIGEVENKILTLLI